MREAIVAHASDCPALSGCCAVRYKTDAYSGVSCNGEAHECEPSDCRAAEQLRELVEAAEAYSEYDPTPKTYHRLDAALQPFRSAPLRAETEAARKGGA